MGLNAQGPSMNDAASRGMAGSWSPMAGGGGMPMGGKLGGGMNGGFSGYGMSPWGGSPWGGGYGAAPWSPFAGGGGMPSGKMGMYGPPSITNPMSPMSGQWGAGPYAPMAGGGGGPNTPPPSAPMAGSAGGPNTPPTGPPQILPQAQAAGATYNTTPDIVTQYQNFQRMNATDPARAAYMQSIMGNDNGAGWRKQMNNAGYYASGKDQNGLYNYAAMPANQQNFGQNRTMI